jgi:uncharacterized membrane protein YgaE (UPF0421/DUF939 family)
MLGLLSIIGGVTGIASNLVTLPLQEQELETQKEEQEANIEKQKALASQKLNETLAHNLVAGSVSGTSLGSQSNLAINQNQIYQESKQQQALDLNEKISDYNNQAQQMQTRVKAISGGVMSGASVGLGVAETMGVNDESQLGGTQSIFQTQNKNPYYF